MPRTVDPARKNELYEQNRGKMNTGDVIGFSGKGPVSNIIKMATKSDYSHVGMVFKIDMGGGFGKSVMVIESTTIIDSPDAIHKEIYCGVQIQWLSKRLEMYDGAAWWAPLKTPLTGQPLREVEEWLRQAHNKRVPYDAAQAIGAGIDCLEGLGLENHSDFSSLFCSELVAKALQIGGMISPRINPAEETPEDVMNYKCFKAPVLVKDDIDYGIILDKDTKTKRNWVYIGPFPDLATARIQRTYLTKLNRDMKKYVAHFTEEEITLKKVRERDEEKGKIVLFSRDVPK